MTHHGLPQKNIYATITASIELFLMAALVFFLARGDWLNALLTTCIIVYNVLPALLYRRYKIFIPPSLQLVGLLFVFSSVFLGCIAQFYALIPWWDTLLHLCSGFLLGFVGFLAVFLLNQTAALHGKLTPLFISLFAAAFAVFLGVSWEIYEFLQDQILPQFNMQSIQTGLSDTMLDLIVDTFGAIVVAYMGYRYLTAGRYEFIIGRGTRALLHYNPALRSHP